MMNFRPKVIIDILAYLALGLALVLFLVGREANQLIPKLILTAAVALFAVGTIIDLVKTEEKRPFRIVVLVLWITLIVFGVIFWNKW